MGFYTPEVLLGDARRHGVDVLPIAINQSAWTATIEPPNRLRLGLQMVTGLGEQRWATINQARQAAPFTDLRDFCQRVCLPKPIVSDLIRLGAFDACGERRNLLWQLGEIEDLANVLLFAESFTPIVLPELPPLERTRWEYDLAGLSATQHLLSHYRATLRQAGVLSTWQVKELAAGRHVYVAGLLVVKQRPPTANGITFISLEMKLVC